METVFQSYMCYMQTGHLETAVPVLVSANTDFYRKFLDEIDDMYIFSEPPEAFRPWFKVK